MNERETDFELLRDFARRGDQPAFGRIVRRHLDLVYATAVRKAGEAEAAQEIAQNVFAILARKAWQFAPDDSVPAWLYRTTLLEAKAWVRGELRRRRREQSAAELGTTMKIQEDQTAFRALVPLLDEALLSLREKDRTALLLRYYEGQSLREVGAALGVGEDAAQKRLKIAVEKVAAFFQRRGYKTVTVAAATTALQQTALSAPPIVAKLVVSASLKACPPVLSGLSLVLARVVSLSKLQMAAACLVVGIAPIFWQWQQVRTVKREETEAQARLNELVVEQSQTTSEVERLRAEAARLEANLPANSPMTARQFAAARNFEELKTRSRALLTAEEYRWPDDLPFVRIPKSALADLHIRGASVAPAQVQVKISDFLDLSPEEREAASLIFSNYFAGTDQLVKSRIYETNQSISLTLPSGAKSKVFVAEPLGEKIRYALGQLSAELSATLGEDRWNMVKPNESEFFRDEQVRLLGYGPWDQRLEVAINVFANPGGEPTISWNASNGTGSSPVPARLLLNKNTSAFFLPQEPKQLAERVTQYIAGELAKMGAK